MSFVTVKSVQQQDMQAVHRVRELLVQQRTALVNQARGLLGERGVTMAQSPEAFKRAVPKILSSCEGEVTSICQAMLLEIMQQIQALEEHVVAGVTRGGKAICLDPWSGLQQIPGRSIPANPAQCSPDGPMHARRGWQVLRLVYLVRLRKRSILHPFGRLTSPVVQTPALSAPGEESGIGNAESLIVVAWCVAEIKDSLIRAR
jgi:hypothetical protein